ncbi:biotin synthase [Dethiosulfatibacter aminovorans DSM 17477]|uniref:Biotin synthase n=1 Tax=Dethiosulfatibacter aminovorans DSM 17477 TaxID=1121476 RepID=A0A1M6F687_9FIRM|nr:radical SAM protein [Dethiosulfatibacter aminovorans]SHI93244.1 biotin synthase [Dethiosulfatibacter aminovorans DSM 17477]
MKNKIDMVYNMAIEGKEIEDGVLVEMLEIDPGSDDAQYLGKKARQLADRVVGNKGKIWASIGIDYQTCPMNCDFCSFGEEWNLFQGRHEWTDEEVIGQVKKYVNEGASWITLRTTQYYGIDRLNALAKKVRKEVPGDYGLVANTGEFGRLKAKEMIDAGIDTVYHTLRLGEGSSTKFNPEDRIDTLKAVEDTNLSLAYLVEPIGPEHTNEEIVEIFKKGLEHGAVLSGAMARVAIKGTPLEEKGELSAERLAQIVAVTRLGAGTNAPDICVHPPSKQAVEWGANVVVVETGAVPRAEKECCGDWDRFDSKKARKWFEEAGYEI